MKLQIDGTSYGEFFEVLETAELGDLRDLKRRHGISAKTIKDAIFWSFEQIGAVGEDEEFDPTVLLDDDTFIENLIGLAWLSKRHAGESVTFDEVARLPFGAYAWEIDEEAAVEADAAPKEDRADDAPRKKPTSTSSTSSSNSSKTSKHPSTKP